MFGIFPFDEKEEKLDRDREAPTQFIFTARKRSLGQGNIFTPVCQSVHMMSFLVWLPDNITGPMFLWGVSVQEGVSV